MSDPVSFMVERYGRVLRGRFATNRHAAVRHVAIAMTATAPAVPDSPSPPVSAAALIPPALAGGAVALALGIYGRVHDATGARIFDLGFPSLGGHEVLAGHDRCVARPSCSWSPRWRCSAACPALRTTPRWVPFAHRWSGTAAFLVSLPVAYHCLWSLGFETTGARQLVHGIAGCVFYGAVHDQAPRPADPRLPRWALPVVGGTLVAGLAVIWLTSALWFFTTVDFPATSERSRPPSWCDPGR